MSTDGTESEPSSQAIAAKLAYARRFFSMDFFAPYPPQEEFLAASASAREIGLVAATQSGKSTVGAYAMAAHLTGRYASWYRGKRFDGPIRAWAVAQSSQLGRDVLQRKLLGDPGILEAQGTGLVPKASIVDVSNSRYGGADTADQVHVRHVSGGTSVLIFKSFEQGREKLQGDTVHLVWIDEEPEEATYHELLSRLTGDGFLFLTATPLLGKTAVMRRLLDEPSNDRRAIRMTLDQAEHFSPEEKRRRLEGYANHERQSRAFGEPLMGSGLVFPFPIETIWEDPIEYAPEHWPRAWGIDPGIGHSFAAVLGMLEPIGEKAEDGILHLTNVYKIRDEIPLVHAHYMRQVCATAPVFYPHDAGAREQGTGDSLAAVYKRHGLKVWHEHSTHPGGGYSLDTSITRVTEMIRAGKLKVAKHLAPWFEEFRNYHYKDGRVVKEDDDALSATFKLVMMMRHFRVAPLGNGNSSPYKRGAWVVENGRQIHVAGGTEDADYWGM